MGQRIVRVNELLKREFSLQMHENYRGETAFITITEVDVSPDLRNARVYYSVVGDEENKKKAIDFFRKTKADLKKRVSSKVTLKYLPNFEFRLDTSLEAGANMWNKMDQIALEDIAAQEEEEEE